MMYCTVPDKFVNERRNFMFFKSIQDQPRSEVSDSNKEDLSEVLDSNKEDNTSVQASSDR